MKRMRDKVFGIKAPDVDVGAGRVEAVKFGAVTEGLKKAFPNLKLIAITLRGSLSASHNTWSGILYDGTRLYTGPSFNITDIVRSRGRRRCLCRRIDLWIEHLRR